MSEDFEDELGAEERLALDRMAREAAPPPALEERVVEALKRAKLLRPRRSVWARAGTRAALAVAASLLLFVLGALAGARWASKPEQSGAPEFMLVLRSAPGRSEPRSAEETARRVREYGDWAGQLRRQGVRVDGEKLASEARFLRGPAGARGPVPETLSAAETIAGYFLIEARDYEQAVRLAEGCPHLKYGGTIEVRQIERF